MLCVGWWLERASLRVFLICAEPWIMDALLISIGACAVFSGGYVARAFRLELRRNVALVASIAVVVCMTVCFVVPRTHRIYYDEDIYQNVALNMIRARRSAMTHESFYEFGDYKLRVMELLKQPSGFPALLGVWFRAFGVSETTAFSLNKAVIFFLVFVLFFLGRRLWGEARAGIYSALSLLAMPDLLRWSNTVSVELSSAFISAVAVLSALGFCRYRSTLLLVLTALLTAYGVQFRPESPLLVAVVALVLLLFYPEVWREKRFWWVALLTLPFAVTLILRLSAVMTEPWGATESKFALKFFWKNFQTNFIYYFNNCDFPLLITLFALAGVLTGRARREKTVLGAWFLLWWGVFLFFYAGSYRYGADVRYALLSFVPIALLAGNGLRWLEDKLKLVLSTVGAKFVIAGGVLVCTLAWAPELRVVGQEGWQARFDHQFAEEIARILPPDSIILTHNPNMFTIWKRSTAQTYFAEKKPETVDGYFTRFAGGVYFYWNYWCNIYASPQQKGWCDAVLKRYDVEVVKETERRGFKLILYRLHKKEGD